MPAYLTGRSVGNLVMSGTMAGPCRVTPITHVSPPGVNPQQEAFAFSFGSASIFVWGCMSNFPAPFGPGGGAPPPDYQFWRVGAYAQGLSVSWDPPGSNTNAFANQGSPPYSNAFTGTWSISIAVEEVVTFTGGTFPSYGGPSTDDMPGEVDVALKLRTKVGGRVTATVTCGGITSSIAGTIMATQDVDLSIGMSVQAFARTAFGESVTASASGTGAVTLNGNTVAIGGSISDSGADYSGSLGGGSAGASVTVSVPLGTTSGLLSSEIVGGTAFAPRSVNMANQARAMNSAYPASPGIRYWGKPTAPYYVDAAGASTSQSFTQERYAIYAEYTIDYYNGIIGHRLDASKDEYRPAFCHLRPGVLGDGDANSLLALGEDQRLWRCCQRGFYRNGMSLTQAASLTFSTGTTASSSGSIIRNLSNFSGSFLGQSAGGYSTMRLQLTADADHQPATIHLGSKQWVVDVMTSGTIDIDLCVPHNNASATDATDSHWPVPTVDGPLWGVTHVTQIRVDGLAGGHSYSLGNVTLERTHEVRLDVLPSFDWWVLETQPVTVGAVTTTTYVRRHLLGDTDGRQSLEIADVTKVVNSGGFGTSTTYGSNTIEDFCASLVGGVGPADGWTGVNLCVHPASGCGVDPAPLNCYLNDQSSLTWLGAGGATHDATGWHYWQQKDVSSALTIPIQVMFDSLSDWYAGCGDVFGFGGATGAIEMRSAVFLRGQSWGLVVKDDGTRDTGITVDLNLAGTTTLVDTGVTDGWGHYLTHSIYGKGLVSYDTVAETVALPWPKVTRTFASRKRHRACLGGVLGGTWVCIDRDYTKRLFLWTCNQHGKLASYIYDDDDANPDIAVIDSATTCACPSIHLNTTYFEGAHLRNKVLYLLQTYDHGNNHIMATIPGAYDYDAIATEQHYNRLVVCGYHTNAGVSDPTGDGWYVQVGQLMTDGSYNWSATPVDMALGAAKPYGDLLSRPDGVLEFGWLDNTGQPQISRCYQLALDGTGTWV